MTRRQLSVLAVLALLAGVIGVLILDTPDTRRIDDVAGRTWVPIAGTDGTDLVLVNGFSGLIEARAFDESGGLIPPGLRRRGSTGSLALLHSGESATVVDTGTNLVHSRDLVAPPVLLGNDLLVLADAPYLTSARSDGGERPLDGAPSPAAEPSPVTDRDGDAWYLTHGDEVSAVRVDSGGDWSTVSVAPETTSLHLIDGAVFAREPNGLRELDGGNTRRLDGESSLVPAVAEGSDGRWAWAEGETVTVDGDEPTRVQLDAPATAVAVWHEAVVVVTDEGASTIVDGRIEPIEGIEGPAELFTDGGVLWVRSSESLVSIWPDLQQVLIRIVTSNLDLCIDTCTAEDARQHRPDRADRRVTQPPRPLDPPPVQPSLPVSTTSTTPFATSTAPTTVPSPSSTVVSSSTTTDTPSSSTVPAPAPPSSAVEPPESSTTPPSPTLPTIPVPEPPAPTTTSTIAPEPEPGQPGVVLTVTPGTASAQITVGVQGSRSQCGVLSRIGELSWSGATTGSRVVRMRWPRGADASNLETVTVEGIEGGGTLNVTFKVCGLTASRSAVIAATVPSVGEMRITPDSPAVNTPVTVDVAMSAPSPWELTSTSWAVGRCGSEAGIGDTSPRQSLQFTPTEPGRYCVQVVATFTSPEDLTTLGAEGEVEAVDTTTSTVPPSSTTTTTTTTTTAPPSSTTTTTSVAPPSSTTTTAAPPDPTTTTTTTTSGP